MNQVNTEILTIEKIIKDHYLFAIPSYQRPYVWGDQEINKLCEDIRLAMEETPEQHYFIGTTLSSLNNGRYELVDGQQRTTTLIVLAIALKELSVEHDMTKLLTIDALRLYFPIRDNVNQLLACQSGIKQSSSMYQDDAYSQGIKNGVEICKCLIQKLEESERKVFLDYLCAKVCWVNNVLPFGADLNKIFRTANFSGIQLEQHEILKARLLAKVTDAQDKSVFAAIWESCQKMDEYFVKNVRDVFNKPSLPRKIEEYREYNPDLFKLAGHNEGVDHEHQYINLLSMIEKLSEIKDKQNKVDETIKTDQKREELEDTEQSYLSSMISFSQLLLHAYRIFLQENGQEDIRFLNEEKLNEVFKDLTDESSDEIMRFIKLLWQVRYYFDLFVVKRIKNNHPQSEYHDVLMIKKQKFNDKGYFETTIVADATALTQLQSILLYTMDRKAQYWLTPFLVDLIQNDKSDLEDESVFNTLENIDNKLSEQRLDHAQKQSLLELSFECCGQNMVLNKLIAEEIETTLSKSSGTGFKHYWFYKLEYLLWKEMDSANDYEKDEKFKNYRITSKNSVEHVYPQQPEDTSRILDNKDLHAFGNLVLLSVGENSSYGNEMPNVKFERFDNKLDRNKTYESLKFKYMRDLARTKEWNHESIKEHQKEMIQLIQMHYALEKV